MNMPGSERAPGHDVGSIGTARMQPVGLCVEQQFTPCDFIIEVGTVCIVLRQNAQLVFKTLNLGLKLLAVDAGDISPCKYYQIMFNQISVCLKHFFF